MAIYTVENWIGIQDVAACTADFPFDNLVRSMDIQHMFDPSKQKYQRTTRVADLTISEEEQLMSIQMPWGTCKDY